MTENLRASGVSRIGWCVGCILFVKTPYCWLKILVFLENPYITLKSFLELNQEIISD